ncbi:uncharacterized protein LOC111627190 [Centruroides sculpturatus]|uniref:uncharacterized protein LOC111627190 n=1 Tax=Centruroides sculpturatus TaxID=218467 RepID=UPI000C6DC560|nr:uncharacterized protein LOC111627190 [Centruroides sculpturatus]
MNGKKVVLFAMPNSQQLGQKISRELGIKLTKIDVTTFADGETILKSTETIRNKDVFVIGATAPPVNENIVQLLIFLDSLKRASSASITVVLSYYGYARQDRKSQGREPIGAKLVADLLATAGATKVIAVDLHNPSIQGFFDLPVDDLRGQYILAKQLKKIASNLMIVSPDHGGAVKARLLADILGGPSEIAIIDKSRSGPNQSTIQGVLGNVEGRDVVIIDDMIDTGGTIVKAAKHLKMAGAKKIIVAATHGIFSRGFDIFKNSPEIDQIVVTDSIEQVTSIKSPKLTVVSLAEFIAKAIEATYSSTSITKIYHQMKERIHN